MTAMWWEIAAFIGGACIGSFLNVVIHRTPRRLSVIAPGSRCPECGMPVRWYDNIPLISWFILLGHCRDCGAPFSIRYALVELVTAILTWGVVHVHGAGIESALYLLLTWGLIAATFIDLDHQIIPDEISVGGAVLGLAVSFLSPVGFTGALAGMAVGGGIFFALAILYPGGMGGGDIKLMGAIGAFLGWKLALVTIIISSVTGAVVGGLSMLFFGKGRKDRIPFGPFLALGGVAALLFGDGLIAWYFARVIGPMAY